MAGRPAPRLRSGTPEIFRAVLAGEDWATVSRSAFGGTGSGGNGGAMRVSPVAVLPRSHTERRSPRSSPGRGDARPPLAQDGAALQCAVVAEAGSSAGRPLDVEALLAAVSAHVTTPEFREVPTIIGALVRRAASRVEIAARLGSDFTALGSVPAATALFPSTPADVEAALVSAVHAGGDTDTIASMVGASVGARAGESGFPPSLLRRLENLDGIREVAAGLASMPAA